MGIIAKLTLYREKRRMKLSFLAPFVGPVYRDTYKCYINGRSVTFGADMMHGEYDAVSYRQKFLTWDDNGEILSTADYTKVYEAMRIYFEKRNMRWKLIET